jgi:hypothetical protein
VCIALSVSLQTALGARAPSDVGHST